MLLPSSSPDQILLIPCLPVVLSSASCVFAPLERDDDESLRSLLAIGVGGHLSCNTHHSCSV